MVPQLHIVKEYNKMEKLAMLARYKAKEVSRSHIYFKAMVFVLIWQVSQSPDALVKPGVLGPFPVFFT